MATLIDYLAWRGDLDFSTVPPNEVDGLILSQIIYLDFDSELSDLKETSNITLLHAMKRYLKARRGQKAKLGALLPKEIILLGTHAAKSKRFGPLIIRNFVNKINESDQSQFCAMTLEFKGARYIVFRGTDDTIVGWKESFNMSFMYPIPAQQEALEYLVRMTENFAGDIYLVGHSKGGNLAVFSAVEAPESIRSQIKAVYNNDGPGFTREFIESEKYISIRDRINTFVPQSSVIGLLLEHEESYVVVKSTQNGIFQHDGLSWEVMGGSFICLEAVTKESKKLDADIKRWLSTMSNEERKRVLDTIYDIFVATEAKTISDLSSEKLKLVKAWGSLDEESKMLIKRCIKALIKAKKEKDEPEELELPELPEEKRAQDESTKKENRLLSIIRKSKNKK